MRFTSLSRLIGEGFEDQVRSGATLPGQRDEAALAEVAVRDLPRLMHDRAVPLGRQDEVLAAAVRCYRRSPGPGWSAVLLEMLAPVLVRVGRRFVYVPETVSDEDFHHQLIAETLHTAGTLPLPEPPRFMQRRIERRVLTRTTRWLIRVVRGEAESLELVVEQGDAYRDNDQRFLAELSDSGVSAASTALLSCSRLLGVSARELAVELGVSPSTVLKRQRQAIARLGLRLPPQVRTMSDELPPAA